MTVTSIALVYNPNTCEGRAVRNLSGGLQWGITEGVTLSPLKSEKDFVKEQINDRKFRWLLQLVDTIQGKECELEK